MIASGSCDEKPKIIRRTGEFFGIIKNRSDRERDDAYDEIIATDVSIGGWGDVTSKFKLGVFGNGKKETIYAKGLKK